jgi:hypothetical protein
MEDPLPRFTGIIHERDSAILDEVIYQKSDTPLKSGLHIARVDRDNASEALTDLERIRVQPTRILASHGQALDVQQDRLATAVGRSLGQAGREVLHRHDAVHTGAVSLVGRQPRPRSHA